MVTRKLSKWFDKEHWSSQACGQRCFSGIKNNNAAQQALFQTKLELAPKLDELRFLAFCNGGEIKLGLGNCLQLVKVRMVTQQRMTMSPSPSNPTPWVLVPRPGDRKFDKKRKVGKNRGHGPTQATSVHNVLFLFN